MPVVGSVVFPVRGIAVFSRVLFRFVAVPVSVRRRFWHCTAFSCRSSALCRFSVLVFGGFGFGSLPVFGFSVRGLSVCSVISGGLLSVVIAIIPV